MESAQKALLVAGPSEPKQTAADLLMSTHICCSETFCCITALLEQDRKLCMSRFSKHAQYLLHKMAECSLYASWLSHLQCHLIQSLLQGN